MTDTSDRENPSTAYARFPAPVVAVVLAAILAVLLAFGFYANANLRPQGIVVPTPVAAAALPTQTLAPTAAAVVQPTATTAAATPSVGLTPVAQVRETATSEAMPVPTVPPPSLTVTARATVSPELQTEVGDAYQTYWQVRAEALYDLDTTHLPEVMAGDHLASAEDLIAQLRIEGRAILTDVTHKYVVLDATSDTATVLDEYVDNSVYVDPLTHDKLTQPQGDTLKEQYEMNKIDEAWKVVTLIRGSQQP